MLDEWAGNMVDSPALGLRFFPANIPPMGVDMRFSCLLALILLAVPAGLRADAPDFNSATSITLTDSAGTTLILQREPDGTWIGAAGRNALVRFAVTVEDVTMGRKAKPTPLPTPPAPPKPKPDNDPPPPPPAPIKVSGIRVLLIYDPAWISTADPKQASIFADPAFLAYLKTACPDNYHAYATTADPAAMRPEFAAIFAAAMGEVKKPLPGLWVFDFAGKELAAVPLPGNAADAIKAIKNAKGD